MNPIISNKRGGPSSQNPGNQNAKVEKKLNLFNPKGTNPKYQMPRLVQNQHEFQIIGVFNKEGEMIPAMIKQKVILYSTDDLRKLGQTDQIIKESESLDKKKAATTASHLVHARALVYAAVNATPPQANTTMAFAESLLKERGVRTDRTKPLTDLDRMANNLTQNMRKAKVSLSDSPSEGCIRNFLNSQSELAATAIADRMVQTITADELPAMNDYMASRNVTHWFFNTLVKSLLDPTIKPDSLFETFFCKEVSKKPYMLVSEVANDLWPDELIGYLLPIMSHILTKFSALANEDKLFAKEFQIPTCALAHEGRALKKDSLGSFDIKIDLKKTQSIPLREFARLVVASVSTIYGITHDFRTSTASACADVFTNIDGGTPITKEIDHPERANLGVQLKTLVMSDNLGHNRVTLFNLDPGSLFVINCRGLAIACPKPEDIKMSSLVAGFSALLSDPPPLKSGVKPGEEADPAKTYRALHALLRDPDKNQVEILASLAKDKERITMIRIATQLDSHVDIVVPKKLAFGPLAPIFGDNVGVTPDENANVLQFLINLRRSSLADSLGLNKKVKSKNRKAPPGVSFLTPADLAMLQQFKFAPESLERVKSFLISFEHKAFKKLALEKIIGGLQLATDLKYNAVSRTGFQSTSSDDDDDSSDENS